jgi:hypothetical protein
MAFDPSVLYPTMKPEPPLRPYYKPEEAAELAAMYPSMRAEIERDCQVTLPPPKSDVEARADLGAFDSWAHTSGVAREAATHLRAAISEALARPESARNTQADAWAAEASATFGGDLDAVVRLARTAVPPELKPLLKRSGLGNKADVIRMFADLARSRR